MSDFNFTPTQLEVRIDETQHILFKFGSNQKLDYINTYFTEFTGYEIHDVVGKNIAILYNDLIPVTISNMITRAVEKRENIHLIINNKTKDNRLYWFVTDFVFNEDSDGNLTSFFYYRKPPSRSAIPALEKLYKKLLDIENKASIEIAEKYLYGFLEEKKMSFQEYTSYLSKGEDFNTLIQQANQQAKKKKSWFKR